MSSRTTVFYGALVNPKSLTSYEALPNCLLAVSRTGAIEWVVKDVHGPMVEQVMAQKGCIDADVVELKRGEFIMPGFVDTHTVCPRVLQIRPPADVSPASMPHRCLTSEGPTVLIGNLDFLSAHVLTADSNTSSLTG